MLLIGTFKASNPHISYGSFLMLLHPFFSVIYYLNFFDSASLFPIEPIFVRGYIIDATLNPHSIVMGSTAKVALGVEIDTRLT
jgi:hypothetical protein